mgnify:FL=1
MLMPSIFGNDMFGDFFTDPWFDEKEFKDMQKKLYGHRAKNVMSTDVKEVENGYELEMDLPGFKKDEIKASVEKGYLTISAARGLDEDEKDKKSGKYIRRERYAGACERSFYVGEGISQDDIKASFQHGILKLFIPKEPEKSVEEKKYVAIEG